MVVVPQYEAAQTRVCSGMRGDSETTEADWFNELCRRAPAHNCSYKGFPDRLIGILESGRKPGSVVAAHILALRTLARRWRRSE
jgi:hypothetical protein